MAGVAASCVRTNVERGKTALVVSKALEQLAADEAADGGVDELVKKLGELEARRRRWSAWRISPR